MLGEALAVAPPQDQGLRGIVTVAGKRGRICGALPRPPA